MDKTCFLKLLMMNEFALRLEKESKHLAHSVMDLKKSLENKSHHHDE